MCNCVMINWAVWQAHRGRSVSWLYIGINVWHVNSVLCKDSLNTTFLTTMPAIRHQFAFLTIGKCYIEEKLLNLILKHLYSWDCPQHTMGTLPFIQRFVGNCKRHVGNPNECISIISYGSLTNAIWYFIGPSNKAGFPLIIAYFIIIYIHVIKE